MKLPLDLTALVVDTFDVTEAPAFTPMREPLANLAEELTRRTCTEVQCCSATCFTNCSPCV